MAESTGDRLSVLKQVLGRKDKEHVVRGAAAHHVLDLLPQEREHQQFGEVGTDVAVAGDAVSVHQHGNTPLVAFGIEVVECHDVHSVLVEIAGGVDVEILGSQPRSAQQRGERER